MKKFFVFALTFMACAINLFAQECTEVPIDIAGTASVTLTRFEQKIIPGVFTVAAGKHVLFSQGNLQYNAVLRSHACGDGSTQPGTWRFAQNQWERMGANNRSVASDYDGWIDLFGWGTSGYDRAGVAADQPWDSSDDGSNYGTESALTEYSDWAQYNTIINGGINGAPAPGVWSVLTLAEWQYLFSKRANAANLICFGTLVNIPGIFLLPDNWTSSIEVTIKTESGTTETHPVSYFMSDAGFSWTPYVEGDYTTSAMQTNVIARSTDASKDLWTALEASGVVFLPAAFQRSGSGGGSLTGQYNGFYWTATARSGTMYARRIYFKVGTDTEDATATLYYETQSTDRSLGLSVRPVYRLD